MYLTNKLHDVTTIDAMLKSLSNSAEKGIELKIIAIDGKVHIAKEILLLFSPVVRKIFAESPQSLVEPKEFCIIMKDVRTSCLRNLRSLLTNGKVHKLLNSSEIEEICFAGPFKYIFYLRKHGIGMVFRFEDITLIIVKLLAKAKAKELTL